MASDLSAVCKPLYRELELLRIKSTFIYYSEITIATNTLTVEVHVCDTRVLQCIFCEVQFLVLLQLLFQAMQYLFFRIRISFKHFLMNTEVYIEV